MVSVCNFIIAPWTVFTAHVKKHWFNQNIYSSLMKTSTSIEYQTIAFLIRYFKFETSRRTARRNCYYFGKKLHFNADFIPWLLLHFHPVSIAANGITSHLFTQSLAKSCATILFQIHKKKPKSVDCHSFSAR